MPLAPQVEQSLHGSRRRRLIQRLAIKSKAWLWISLVFLALYILLGYTGNLVYHIIDDPAVISITKRGDFRTPYTHSILGWFFMSLYSWKGDFFWCDLLIVMIYSAVICRFFFLFNVYRKLSYPVAILLISCVLLGFMPFQPNFTFLAMFLSIVAIFPFLVGDTEDAPCLSWRNLNISFLFLFAACLYRSLAVIMIVGCGLGIHILLATCEVIKKCPESSVKNFWRRTGILVGMACFALFMHFINMYIYTSSPEYARQIEYDKYRLGFTDYNKYKYNKTFEELGISKNDFDLMSNYFGIDSPPLQLENLRRLPSVPVQEIRRMNIGLRQALRSLSNKDSLVLLAILLCASLFSRQAQVTSVVCIASIIAIAIFTSRMLPRVYLPFLAFGAITSIFFLGSELQIDNLRRSRVDFCFLFFLVFILAFLANVKFQYLKIDEQTKNLKRAVSIWEFCQKSNINQVAHWPLATSDGNRILFTSVKQPRATRINYIGNWMDSYPKRLKKLREIYGQDIYAGLARPGTYHLVRKRSKIQTRFETFVREHGPENAEPRVMFDTERTVLYQIYEKKPTG